MAPSLTSLQFLTRVNHYHFSERAPNVRWLCPFSPASRTPAERWAVANDPTAAQSLHQLIPDCYSSFDQIENCVVPHCRVLFTCMAQPQRSSLLVCRSSFRTRGARVSNPGPDERIPGSCQLPASIASEFDTVGWFATTTCCLS